MGYLTPVPVDKGLCLSGQSCPDTVQRLMSPVYRSDGVLSSTSKDSVVVAVEQPPLHPDLPDSKEGRVVSEGLGDSWSHPPPSFPLPSPPDPTPSLSKGDVNNSYCLWSYL